ncbi:MAG: HAD-IIA family hydrolase [Candidatus Helarchaeota archaeon]
MDLLKIQLFIFDLDGVIYLGNGPIPKAKEVITSLKEKGKKVFYLTNNSTRTRSQFAEKLRQMGIQVTSNQIITSAYATAQYIKNLKPKASIYLIGEEGLFQEFKSAKFTIYSEINFKQKVDFVVIGLDRQFNFQKLATALCVLERGAQFIATNDDPTLPTEHGNLPGAGALVAALQTAYGAKPLIIIGKPNTFMLDFILKQSKIHPKDAVIIGDRYTTDIMAGINAHMRTIMVKSGSGISELPKIPIAGPNPDLILDSIANILDFL